MAIGRLRAAVAAVSLACGLAVAVSARAADATVAASREPEGYARLVFKFDRPPAPEAKLSSNVLVVSFSEPMEIDLAPALKALGPLVSVARRDPDGTALRIALNRPVKLNATQAGDLFFVDLLPAAWSGLPPPLPKDVVAALSREALAARASERAQALRRARPADPLTVEGATHPTFRRLVFKLPDEVSASVKRVGDKAEIAFGAALSFDLPAARADLPPELSAIGLRRGPSSVTVVAPAPGLGGVRSFREDGAFIVDIDRADAASTDAEPAAHGDASARPPAAAESAPDPSATGREPQPWSVGTSPAAKDPPAPSPVQKPAKTAGDDAPSSPAAPAVSRAGETLRLSFPFAAPTPAAVFARGRTIWAVFDSQAHFDLEPLVAASGGALLGVERTEVEGGQAIRLTLPKPRLVSAAPDGTAWTLSIGEGILSRTEPLALSAAVGLDGGAALAVRVEGVGTARTFRDPAVGDLLAVATLDGPPRGLVRPQNFVELAALQTAQGVALALAAEDVRIDVAPGGTVISRPGGLSLSAKAAPVAAAPAATAIDAGSWDDEASRPFQPRENDLLARAAMAAPERRTDERFGLATFYLATARPADAKAVLGAILEDDQAASRGGRLPILRAAAEVALGRARSALAILAAPQCAALPEAALWRAAANAGLDRFGPARDELRAGEPGLRNMPPALQARFVSLGVDLALRAGDGPAAAARFERLESLPALHGLGERELMRARVAQALGQTERALRIYAPLITGSDPAAAAEATLRDAELRLAKGSIRPEEAIERLERLVTGWRGDAVEAEALVRLVELYGGSDRWRDAFKTLRIAVEAFPDDDETRAFQDEMQNRFATLFLGGGLSSISKLDALALFYDFKELSPTGKRGDELVRKLADQLVEVDLLDQAADLLNYQIENRLSGAARAQVAARVALVDLMNGKPRDAVEVLRKTRQADLPASLMRNRLTLEARALAGAGQVELALDMAESLDGAEGSRLRAEILWAAKRWTEAGEAFEVTLGGAWRDGAPLDAGARSEVMRAAIALSLGGDGLGLDRIRQKYAAQIAQSPDAAAFEVVTAPIERRGVAFREIARSIASIASFDGFLKEYRRQAGEPTVSDTSGARAANEDPAGDLSKG